MPNYFLPIQNGDGDAILVKEDTRKRLFSLNFPIYFFQFREIRIRIDERMNHDSWLVLTRSNESLPFCDTGTLDCTKTPIQSWKSNKLFMPCTSFVGDQYLSKHDSFTAGSRVYIYLLAGQLRQIFIRYNCHDPSTWSRIFSQKYSESRYIDFVTSSCKISFQI